MRLQERVAIVTGAARGIGKGIAIRLLEEGARVWACDISESGIAQSVADLRSYGDAAGGVANVADRASVATLIETVVARWSRVDVMVNNAGIAHWAALIDVEDKDWDRVLNVNLRGTFLGTQLAARQMIKQGSGGAIVNIGSTNGLRGQPGLAPYGASKAGIINLGMSAALELGEHGIRVNTICPGTVWNEMSAEAGLPNEFWDELREQTAVGRFGVPADIAAAVAFAASDDAAFMTGQAIVVDGGITARQLFQRFTRRPELAVPRDQQ
jgi:3-oxoacyl-[acyl-carrier protein] reductase